jgi:hypothetical protein
MTDKTITVVAIAQGFDNLCVRNVGDTFEVPADVFDPRPVLDANRKPIAGQFHELPNWFEPLDEKLKESFRKRRDDQATTSLSVDPAQQAAAHAIANEKLAEAQGATDSNASLAQLRLEVAALREQLAQQGRPPSPAEVAALRTPEPVQPARVPAESLKPEPDETDDKPHGKHKK